VELEARPVTVYSNELNSYEYPYVKFTSRVSSGTYIRSLVEDLGKLLATGAYMSDLRRTAIADFDLSQALSPQNMTITDIEHNLLTSEK
jgi:tRNA pseudouridine55 synthase